MSLVASSHGSMEPGCIRAVFPEAGLIRTSSFNVARSNEITRYVKAAKLAQPRKMCSYNTSCRACFFLNVKTKIVENTLLRNRCFKNHIQLNGPLNECAMKFHCVSDYHPFRHHPVSVPGPKRER